MISNQMAAVVEIACAASCVALFLVVFFVIKLCQTVKALKPRIPSLNIDITVTLKKARQQRRRRRRGRYVNENAHRAQRRPQENDEYGDLFNGQNYGRQFFILLPL